MSDAPLEGRWIRDRGQLLDNCVYPGCKRYIEKGEWYFRWWAGVFCEQCANDAGVFRDGQP